VEFIGACLIGGLLSGAAMVAYGQLKKDYTKGRNKKN